MRTYPIWMESLECMRGFISTHVLPGAEEREWDSDMGECGELLWDACEWYRIEPHRGPDGGDAFTVTVCVAGGYWAKAYGQFICLAACMALCRATQIRLEAEKGVV